MGLIKKTQHYTFKLIAIAIAFIGVPLFLYYQGDFQRRGFLMETLSIITIIGFTLLLSQFFSTRLNKKLVKKIRMVNVLTIHKFIGYVFISILLLHPFLILIPKFFDDAVTPTDAFLNILTQFDSLGIFLGLTAYTLMLALLVTSFFRFKLHLQYRTWRNLHGYLTLLFVLTATWHVIKLGRHSNTTFSIYYVFMVAGGIFYLLKTYLLKTTEK